MFHTAEALERPQLDGEVVLVRTQPRPCERRKKAICRLTRRAAAQRFHPIGNPDVITHALNILMLPFVHPRQALEFRIEVGPFFQRLRIMQAHFHGLLKIRRSRVRGIDIAVKLRVRIARPDFTHHCQRLALVGMRLAWQTENEREDASNTSLMTLFGNVMKDSSSLKPDLVYGAQHVFGARFGSDQNAAQSALPHQADFFVAASQEKIRSRLDVPFELAAGLNETPRDLDTPLTVDEKVIVDNKDEFDTKSLDKLQNFRNNALGRQCIPGAAVETGVRTK